jgi:hypothetical protein
MTLIRVFVTRGVTVLDPTGASSGLFLHPWVEPTPDPYRTGFRCGFRFPPASAPEIQKKPKTQKNPKGTRKKPESQKTLKRNPNKIQNQRKNPMETWKTPERNTFTKSDGHPNPTRNPMGSGSGARFHSWVRVRVSNSTWLHFFAGQVFGQPNPNLTHCHP